MTYISRDELLAVGATQCWADAVVITGKLYDEAFVQRRNNGSSAGGFSQASFNGKEISCTIVPRYMKNGSWSSTTRWKVDGKRVAHKRLIQTICGPL